jgi:hypothetical protein
VNAKRNLFSLLFLLTGWIGSVGTLHAAISRSAATPDVNTATRQVLPLKIFHDYLPVVEARLGNSAQPVNFVLDTGTSPTIINLSLANQLGLITKSSALADIGQIIPTQAATIPEVDLGPIRVFSLPVKVQNLSELESELGISIAGILGLDVLSKSSFQLDYNRKEIAFGGASPGGIPVQFDTFSSMAVAQVKIGGRTTRMLVDTGTDRVVLFGGNFANLAWLSPRNTSQRGRSLMSREMPVQIFAAPDIVLGKRHFSKDRAYLVPGSSDPEIDGLLGVRALGFRGLSFDPSSGTLFLLS